jgi:hypothetical protein
MKKLTPSLLTGLVIASLTLWTGQLSVLAQTGAGGGNNTTPTHNVNNTGGTGINGGGNATSGGATSSTSGGNPNGGQTASGETSSGATTHVNTATGITPGDGNSGVTHTPPSGVSPGTGASPNPQ